MFEKIYNVEIHANDIFDLGSANDRMEFIIKLLDENPSVSRKIISEIRSIMTIYVGFLFNCIDQLDFERNDQNGSKSEPL